MIRLMLGLCLILPAPVLAADLYRPNSWSALASDRKAAAPGDILTILIYENASGANSSNTKSAKKNSLDGQISSGSSFSKNGSLSFAGASDNQGSTGRSGQMVAQMSAVVEQVLANGDLEISGAQRLNINRERTVIRVRGRVRPTDISADNMVLSSRIADASIDYDGAGFVTRSGRPGLVTRIFNFLGLM